MTNSNGVLDNDQKTIPHITVKNWEKVKKYVYTIDDATGGMQHKIESSLNLIKYKIKTVIINGTIPHELRHALNGNTVQGTIIS